MKSSVEKTIKGFYIAVQCVLFLLIKIAELTAPYTLTRKLMFFAIFINFAVTAYFFLRETREKRLSDFSFSAVFLSMLLTLLADTFLVLIDGFYLAGVMLFCAVQTVYAFYLGMSRQQAIVRFIWFALLFLTVLFIGALNLLSGFAAFSMAMLSVNAVTAWRRYGRNKTKAGLLLALGLTLFLLCDVNVGAMNATAVGTFANELSAYLIWTFYLPSQVLIVLSFAEK